MLSIDFVATELDDESKVLDPTSLRKAIRLNGRTGHQPTTEPEPKSRMAA